MYEVLRFLHFLAMALWIATALQLTARLRALSTNPSQENPAWKANAGSAGPFGHVAALLSIGTGVALIFQLGGFGAVPWPIHASLLLGLGLWGLLAVAERGYASVHAAIARGEGDAASLGGRLRTARLLTVGFHSGWSLVLFFMTFRYVIA